MAETLSEQDKGAILQSLRQLETRISRLEAHMGLPPAPSGEEEPAGAHATGNGEAELEQRIGEFGLAWAGSIVFLLGLAFLITYTLNQGHSVIAALMGYGVAGGIYVLARAWQKSFLYLSRILLSASLLLVFYATLRLHYFTASPLLKSAPLAYLLLMVSAAFPFFLALRLPSQGFAVLPVVLWLMTALLSESPHVMLSLTAILAVGAVILARRCGWWLLLNLSIVLVYLAHLLWLLNDPVAGHAVSAITADRYPLPYLLLCAAIFAWPPLFNERDDFSNVPQIGIVALNCLGCSFVLCLALLTVYQKAAAPVMFAVASLLLVCSVVQWWKTRLQFAATVYACFGYVALSLAIYGYAKTPGAFLWLALQSFLVVSMALWFRSRTLVVANAVIYFGILSGYWFFSPLSNAVNFGFALVALLSARVMNWQKERLTLRTEGLRNTYLAATFVMVLYALYHAVPPSYVALSWTLTAAGYFLLSILLRNVKYRWMSLFNLMATVAYLFLVDLARLDVKSRVAAFLLLGLMAVGISIFYTKLRRPASKP